MNEQVLKKPTQYIEGVNYQEFYCKQGCDGEKYFQIDSENLPYCSNCRTYTESGTRINPGLIYYQTIKRRLV